MLQMYVESKVLIMRKHVDSTCSHLDPTFYVDFETYDHVSATIRLRTFGCTLLGEFEMQLMMHICDIL